MVIVIQGGSITFSGENRKRRQRVLASGEKESVETLEELRKKWNLSQCFKPLSIAVRKIFLSISFLKFFLKVQLTRNFCDSSDNLKYC